jgi:hypothetical protein
MLTYQDFTEAVNNGRLLSFLRKAINQHRDNDEYKMAVIADEYDRQRNRTINEVMQKFYDANGIQYVDFTARNNRIASNFFHRLNKQRCTYSLGNGVTFEDSGIKDKLGKKFDTDLYKLAYKALIHGVAFGFWNVDRLHVFPLTEFVPLWDEDDGTLRAGIRYWCLDWNKKPVTAVLYEEDGYTKYRSENGRNGLNLAEIEPKHSYKQTIQHTEAAGDEVVGEDNYGSLPIVPLYGNDAKQSSLVGMRAAIDSYDLIQSGFANDLQDCAQIYWMIGNALGMENEDVRQFMDRIRLQHIAVVDTDNSSVTPYTQDVPYEGREAYLSRISNSIYRDFGAFNPEDVAAGNITATQIRAAYQAQDEEADAFEYQIIECVQQILALQGLEGTPQFSRNRIANQQEEVNMVVSEAEWLDDETVLDLLPNITPDMKEAIMERKDVQDAQRLQSDDELESRVKAMVDDILKGQQTGAVEQDNNGGYRYVE